jgi:hypothetical protein
MAENAQNAEGPIAAGGCSAPQFAKRKCSGRGEWLAAVRGWIVSVITLRRWIVAVRGWIVAIVATTICGWIGVRRRRRIVAISGWIVGVRRRWRIIAIHGRIGIRHRVAVAAVLATPIADLLNQRGPDVWAV